MAESMEVPLLDRFVLIRTWEDLTDREQGEFAGHAAAAAEAYHIKQEKEKIEDLLDIILFEEDLPQIQREGVGQLNVATAWSILSQVPPEDSEVFEHLSQIECISPLGGN